MGRGELVCYAIYQPYLVICGRQFPQLEEQIVPGSEPAIFRYQLTTTSHGIRTPAERPGRVVSQRDAGHGCPLCWLRHTHVM